MLWSTALHDASIPEAGVDDPLVAWRLQKESGVRSDFVLCRAADFIEDRNTPNTPAGIANPIR
jgi:hypothetical protein